MLRQFIHAEDLARVIMKLLPVIKQDTVIVADNQSEVTIKSVAETIATTRSIYARRGAASSHRLLPKPEYRGPVGALNKAILGNRSSDLYPA